MNLGRVLGAHRQRRQLERQARATLGVVRRPHAPAVRVRDLAHDREAKARSGQAARYARAVEAVEHVR